MKEFLNPMVVMRATRAAASWPAPCILKTAAIMAPRQRVGANLDGVRCQMYNDVVHVPTLMIRRIDQRLKHAPSI